MIGSEPVGTSKPIPAPVSLVTSASPLSPAKSFSLAGKPVTFPPPTVNTVVKNSCDGVPQLHGGWEPLRVGIALTPSALGQLATNEDVPLGETA